MTFQPLSTGLMLSQNVVSTVNSSTTILAANATFTGTFENVLSYQEISIEGVSDVDGTLLLDISADGSTVLTSFSTATNTGVVFIRSPIPQTFVRIRYTNGATNQTQFVLTTLYRPIAGGVAQVPINSPIFNASLAANERSVIFSKDTNGNYNAIGMNLDGGLNVHVTDFPAIQPVSGTVTANAGTGTFTVGQTIGTNLHTVLDSGTLTSITNALPTGANTIGAVTQASGPWTSNITQISGGAIAVAATGIAKIGLTDGSGNAVTSQVNGSQRALDVGIDVAGVQIDPRAQGTAASLSGAWPVKTTDGTNAITVKAASTAAVAADTSEVVALSPNSSVPAGANAIGSVSLGNTTGKSVVMKTGTLVTTATTVDQVVLTYTVTTGKTFYVEYVEMQAAQTTPAGGTGIVLGTISLENPSGTKVISGRFIGGGSEQFGEMTFPFSEPIPVSSATIIRVVTTPAATTSMTWIANFGGYEK